MKITLLATLALLPMFAACEPTVRSAYVRSSRCVIALALSAKLWCNVFFVADMNITPINGLMPLYSS
jgi:hypothetical protein